MNETRMDFEKEVERFLGFATNEDLIINWAKSIAQRVELQTIQRKDKYAEEMTGKPFVLLYSQDK